MCSWSAIKMPFERAADLRARTVQQHALVALGDVERLADLLCVAALDVAHRDDDPLRIRQSMDRREHQIERLAIGELLRGELLPVAGGGTPVAGERIVCAAEALRLDGGLDALTCERGE